jgi:hypothetical protein
MALTDNQRDKLLLDLNNKVDKILRLLDPPHPEAPQRVVKRDPSKLYGGN